MPSLKEVKIRINSVSSTRKITSAMKLVASSKLRKAQQTIGGMRPYQRRLDGMMARLTAEVGEGFSSPLSEERPVQRAVVVCLSSNSSLCGAFNSNAIKATLAVIEKLQKQGARVEVIPVGQKIAEKMKKSGFSVESANAALLDRPQYADMAAVADGLMQRFIRKEIDKVVLVYNHFKNTATQVITTEPLLPVSLESVEATDSQPASDNIQDNYIIEPSGKELLESLLPKGIALRLYTAVLDSLAAEHSARVIAMQTATDNADQLLHDLTLMYNKTRQSAITAELLDIVGASFQ
ncbi:MAG: ATP synthase F1 subunit gamma [Bacteroidaceae bacterium]|nr:ATP synthase F1 subunit gamma [Bacteroidaceae bacterium]